MNCKLLVALGLVGPVYTKWQPVNEPDFRESLQKNDYTLVAYIPAIRNSFESFEEEWSSLRYSGAGNGAVISIDCSVNQKLCQEYDVVSFPAIRLHRRDGRTERYRGARRSKDIEAYFRRMSRPLVSQLNGKNMSSFMSIDDVVIIAQLGEEDKSLEERFTKAAEYYHDRYSFAIRQRNAHGRASLDCINNINFEQRSLTELSDSLAMDRFINQCARSLIPQFTRRNEGEISQMGKSIVHYLTSSEQDRESYTGAFRSMAKKYNDYLIFVTTDVTEYPEMLSMTGHKSGSNRVLSVVSPTNGAVFPYRGKEITPDTIEVFLTDISSGQVKPWDGILKEPDIEIDEHDEL